MGRYSGSGAVIPTGTGFTHITTGTQDAAAKLVANADVSATAAIAKTKLAALDIVDSDVNAAASIAKTKLGALDIVNSDVNTGANIAFSKLNGGVCSLTSDIEIIASGGPRYLIISQAGGTCAISGPSGAPGYALVLQGGFAGGTLIIGTNGSVSNIAINQNHVLFPIQAAGASPPTYVAGGIFYNTTTGKMMIGGATAWETVTSG